MKYIILAALIFSLLGNLGLTHCGPGIEEMRLHSEEKDRQHEAVVSDIMKQVCQLKTENFTLRTEKKKILAYVDELEKKPVTAPGEIETVVINKIEYVPKVEYITLYQFDTALRRAFRKYIGLDIQEQDTADQIALKLEEVDRQRQKQLTDLRNAMDYYYRKAKKKSFLGFGIGIGYGLVKADNGYRFRCSITCGLYYVRNIF